MRTTRRRRRRDTPLAAWVLIRGLAVIAFGAVIGWLALSFYNGVPTRTYVTARAVVPQVGNLIKHDQVRIAGIRVGQVQSIQNTSDGQAQLSLQLEPGTKMPVDSAILVRANGLLGARYVQLIPGSSQRMLPDGATLLGAADAYAYGVPEALDTFDAHTRKAFGSLVNELGRGTVGRGAALNDGVHAAAYAVRPFRRVVRAILDRPGASERLLPELDRGVGALDDSRTALAALVGATADGLQPVVAERGAVQATLSSAPTALASTRANLQRARRLLAVIATLARRIHTTTAPAPAGLRAAAALLRESHRPLARATRLLAVARSAVPSTLKVTRALRPVLAPLNAATDTLTPIVSYLGRYGCDIENFGAAFRSATGFGTYGSGPAGPLGAFRFTFVTSPESHLGVTDTSGGLHQAGYPAPCRWPSKKYAGT